MTLEQAKNEYAEMVSNASHCFRRSIRMERMNDLRAADASWQDGIHWQMQSQRDNLQNALALHA